MSYLQPAEMRPGLVEADRPRRGVAPTSTCRFQHASAPVLRRMRRFGGTERFLELLDAGPRDWRPRRASAATSSSASPARPRPTSPSSRRFLTAARLDAVGVFGYSDEDGTEAAALRGKLDRDEIDARVARLTELVEELIAQRAEERVGEQVEVLVESIDGDGVRGPGRAPGPEVDGTTSAGRAAASVARRRPRRATRRRHRGRRPGRRASRRRRSRGTAPCGTARRAWNIANALTVLRMLLVPVLGVAAAGRRRRERRGCAVASFVVFVIAMVTDRVDGDMARGPGAGHRLRQDRRPDRRQGADRHRAGRAVGAGRAAVVGDDRRSWSARSASRCCGSS